MTEESLVKKPEDSVNSKLQEWETEEDTTSTVQLILTEDRVDKLFQEAVL